MPSLPSRNFGNHTFYQLCYISEKDNDVKGISRIFQFHEGIREITKKASCNSREQINLTVTNSNNIDIKNNNNNLNINNTNDNKTKSLNADRIRGLEEELSKMKQTICQLNQVCCLHAWFLFVCKFVVCMHGFCLYASLLFVCMFVCLFVFC